VAVGSQRARPGHDRALDRPAPLRKSAAELVDRDRSQRVLVYVHSITIIRLASNQKKERPASGQTSIEAKATLLSGHARQSREGGGDTTLASRQPTDTQE
jgi:hypothetical protein